MRATEAACREPMRAKAVPTRHDVKSFDTKGMYAKAQRGGIDNPYEHPLEAQPELDAVSRTAEQKARMMLVHLQARGFVRRERRVEPA